MRGVIRWFSYDFTHKAVIVTGGASGIGRSIAERFIGAGASVLIADKNAEGAEELAGSLGNGRAQAHAVDVTSAPSVAGMIEAAASAFGRLDYLVNCAGVAGEAAPVAECSTENWNAVLAVNLTGIFLSMKYAITANPEAGWRDRKPILRRRVGGCAQSDPLYRQ